MSFVGGGSSAMETTNSSGVATSPLLAANDTAGAVAVTASVAGINPITFSLTNLAGVPADLAPGVGTAQSTPVDSPFPIPLAVTVTDADKNRVPGVVVTFSAPSSGPSGTFAGASYTASVTTNASGIAVAPTFSANDVEGGYIVTAAVAGGSPPATFSMVNQAGAAPATSTDIVGMAATPCGGGYWLVASDGGVFSFGNAQFYGSAGNFKLNAPIVGMAANPGGGGYWLVASGGGIFSFGAPFEGSTGGIRLNQPIVGMAATPEGGGYWLVASDGGVFSFGNAQFYGSMGGTHLDQPIVGMAATPGGGGYRLVASDGGIFSFGNATFFGSTGGQRLNEPAVGMAAASNGSYWVVASDGVVLSFGDAPYSA
jgi:hypothetical protein